MHYATVRFKAVREETSTESDTPVADKIDNIKLGCQHQRRPLPEEDTARDRV